jgi:oligosaccharyltransferase complex subunit alpha (ribophorin I)
MTLDIEVVYARALRLYPSEITQGERQLVLYDTNAYYYSRYTTQTQKTVLTLPTNRAESYSQTPKPATKADQIITYGPYENSAPFTTHDISVHYENNNPFLTVSNLNRWIEISHWGNIAVEETVDMYHSGAQLTGPFSRLDFQRRQDSYSAVKSFKVDRHRSHELQSLPALLYARHHCLLRLVTSPIATRSATCRPAT